MMLVANLMAPQALATPMLPRRSNRWREGDSAHDITTTLPPGEPTQAQHEIQRHPLDRPRIKSNYTFQEFLRAVAAASAPFRNLGRMVGDAYEAMSGDEADPSAIATAQRVGSVVDAATGLIPNVQITRLPGRVADVGADALDGKPPQSSKITDLLQFGDPRSFGGQVPAPQDSPSGQPVVFRRVPVLEAAPADGIDAGQLPVDGNPPAVPPEAASPNDDDPLGPRGSAADTGSVDDIDALDAPDDADSTLRIEGEREYLQGYEQTLPSAQVTTGSRRQLVAIEGRRYLAGRSGYYHVTPGQSANQWLINAPRGTRAQVPVTYDAQTQTWRADPPLRLCGGGCGPSRASSPDSVDVSKNGVAEATLHIANLDVRNAIQQAYGDLAHLHLMRTNREDLRSLRDNSIVEHRRILVPQLMRIDPHSTLFEQQREAALITAIHYDNYVDNSLLDLSPEAFCQENAEILFHYLLARGIPGNNIRMITVRSQGRPPHVMVLYTESDPFIDMLDLTTPQPPILGHDDGISGDVFASALFLSRDSTVLLDPWSRVKASSFPWTNDVDEVRRVLDIALADTARIPGSPYTVSLTRPYPAPRERSVSSSGSSTSARSQSSSAGDSIGSGPSHQNPLDSLPKGGRDTPL
ncbi:hypothetical protein [Pandoraea horticolens]|uniref:hypothetical protein n=1 Tax=Pandoraea horticolens TaxID=2508298 RepID=UPI0015817B53|nr:hypothetical protein [Pandoraea horticolens]